MINANRLIPVVFVLVFFSVSTAPVQAEDYAYVTNNGTITVTGYTGPGGDVTIPASINGLPVVSIGDWAFKGCETLTNLTIPNTVTTIQEGAFWDCYYLSHIIIPNSVTSIQWGVFGNCTHLNNVTLPNSLTNIGPGAFGSAHALTSIVIPSSITRIEPGTFFESALTNVCIPESVTNIGDSAFFTCPFLNNITIPKSVSLIESDAFRFCGLTNVTIRGGLLTIRGGAFRECRNLTAVSFSGDAPPDDGIFGNPSGVWGEFYPTNATVYYLPGTVGWGATFSGQPTAHWLRPNPQILTTGPNFGIQNNAFGFRISWATNASVVVEASISLANPLWSPVSTNTLVNGWADFRDARWKNHPARSYRVRQW